MAPMSTVSTDGDLATTASISANRKLYRLCKSEHFQEKARDRKFAKQIRRYYKRQAKLLRKYQEDRKRLADLPVKEPSITGRPARWDKECMLQYVTFACNVVLFAGKIVATLLSGSLSILSSMIDSLVDNASNVVIAVTNRAIRTRDPYHYPRGRTRLEPLALIIISVIMGVASLQVIVKTIESIVDGTVDPKIEIIDGDVNWTVRAIPVTEIINSTYVVNATEFINGTVIWRYDWRTIGVMISTVVVKFSLFVTCYVVGRSSPTIMVLAQDHRNDCLSNIVAIACGILGAKYWRHIDSIGAILISVYIAASWINTGYKQVSILSGHSAPPYFISRIIKVCLDHHEEIRQVDAVVVYHFGTQFIVEVDIVVDENMTVHRAHHISEPLQNKLEHLPDVERAFVHVDFQTKHAAYDEHKSV